MATDSPPSTPTHPDAKFDPLRIMNSDSNTPVKVGCQDSNVIELSPLDTIQHFFPIFILVVFPPPRAGGVGPRSGVPATHNDNAPIRTFEDRSDTIWSQRLTTSFDTLLQFYPNLSSRVLFSRDTGTSCLSLDDTLRPRLSHDTSEWTTDDAIASRSIDFLPSNDSISGTLGAKITSLIDGGISIGVLSSHVLFDAESLIAFVRNWLNLANGVAVNATSYNTTDRGKHMHVPIIVNNDRGLVSARGKKPIYHHHEYKVISSTLPSPAPSTDSLTETRSNIVVKLSQPQIQKMKDWHMKLIGKSFSSVISMSALIAVILTASSMHGNAIKTVIAVNGRKKLVPPLPDGYVGNAVFYANTRHDHDELIHSTSDLADAAITMTCITHTAKRIKATVDSMTPEYLQDAIDYIASQKMQSDVTSNANIGDGPDILVTSWANLGLRDLCLDDGIVNGDLRQAVYAGPPSVPANRLAFILDCNFGQESRDGAECADLPALYAVVCVEKTIAQSFETSWNRVVTDCLS